MTSPLGKRQRSPSTDIIKDFPTKKPNLGAVTEPIYATHIQHTTHWSEATCICDNGVLKFAKLIKVNPTDAEKKLDNLGLFLIWFGIYAEYPDWHPLSKGSRDGVARFRLLEAGLLNPFLKEFDLRESDIKIWKYARTYRNEINTCYVITKNDYKLGPELTPVTVEQFKLDHFDSVHNRFVFKLSRHINGKYDTLSLAFEQPEPGHVWKLNPLTAKLDVVKHSITIPCKYMRCSDIQISSETRRKYIEFANDWNRQRTNLSATDRAVLKNLKNEISNNQSKPLYLKQQKIMPVLFQKITDALKSLGLSVEQLPLNSNDRVTILFRVKQRPTDKEFFNLKFTYNKILLSGKQFELGKASLTTAIDRVVATSRVLSNITNQPNRPIPPKPVFNVQLSTNKSVVRHNE